ncbi:MAG: hypothetical protein ACLUW6_08445 [Coriobacteriaceae bacterium]
MTDSQTEIKLLSSMYESTLASVDEISAAGIEQLANYTKFDYTTISLSDGLTIDDKGQEADASDREYFARGMEGESGVCAVENSLFYNDLSVIFYTPLYFKDEWLASLRRVSGRFHGEVPAHLYFQRADQHYLLDRNGDVMAHSSITYTSGVKNAVDLYLEDESSGNISRTELRRLWKAACPSLSTIRGIRARVPRTSCPSRTTTGSSCAPSPALSPTACRAGRMRPVSCWWPSLVARWPWWRAFCSCRLCASAVSS